MLPETIAKGGYTEAIVAARALEKGFVPSKPMVDARYDLAIDNGKEIQRVQVKYCDTLHSSANGSVCVNLRKNGKPYTRNEVDAVVVYVAPSKQLCWLPIELVDGKTSITIRYEDSKNCQTKNCVMAQDYAW